MMFTCSYPQCLHFLELLQSEQFRREIANMHCAKFIDEQVLLHWHHYNKKRSKTTQQLLSKTWKCCVHISRHTHTRTHTYTHTHIHTERLNVRQYGVIKCVCTTIYLLCVFFVALGNNKITQKMS